MASPIVGTLQVTCPGCGLEHSARLIQSINTHVDPDARARLLEGDFNVVRCDCGRQTRLEANLLFHDPDANYFCQVCPGGADAMARAAEAFRALGAVGTQRLVPSTNALVEKLQLLEAGLDDRAIEMAKVLLLASTDERDLDRVLLFDRVDRGAGMIHWVLFDAQGATATAASSGLVAYDRLAARLIDRPEETSLQVDRAWALEAVRTMIQGAS